MMRNSRGEIATILTLISMGLMIAGIAVGTVVTKKETRVGSHASDGAGCVGCDGPGGLCSPGRGGADLRGCGGFDGCRSWEYCSGTCIDTTNGGNNPPTAQSCGAGGNPTNTPPAGQSTPTPTSPQASGTFHLTAAIRPKIVEDPSQGCNVNITFVSDGCDGDIRLDKNGAMIAGINGWNAGFGPFTYYDQFTGSPYNPGTSVTFTGWIVRGPRNCGNTSSSITLTMPQNCNRDYGPTPDPTDPIPTIPTQYPTTAPPTAQPTNIPPTGPDCETKYGGVCLSTYTTSCHHPRSGDYSCGYGKYCCLDKCEVDLPYTCLLSSLCTPGFALAQITNNYGCTADKVCCTLPLGSPTPVETITPQPTGTITPSPSSPTPSGKYIKGTVKIDNNSNINLSKITLNHGQYFLCIADEEYKKMPECKSYYPYFDISTDQHSFNIDKWNDNKPINLPHVWVQLILRVTIDGTTYHYCDPHGTTSADCVFVNQARQIFVPSENNNFVITLDDNVSGPRDTPTPRPTSAGASAITEDYTQSGYMSVMDKYATNLYSPVQVSQWIETVRQTNMPYHPGLHFYYCNPEELDPNKGGCNFPE